MTGRRPMQGKTEAPEYLTVREADVRYPDQWVLMKVTSFEDLHTGVAGEIVAHGTRRQVHKKMMAMTAGGKWLEDPHYLFCAGPDNIRSPDDFRDDIEPFWSWAREGARRGH